MDDLFFATFAGIVQDGANDPLNPTAMGLSRSGVSLLGQVSTADFDYFYIPIPSGMKLSTIKLTNYSAQVPSTNIYIQKGTQFKSSQDPSAFVLSQPFGNADIGKVLPIVSSTAVSNGIVLLISQNGPAANYAVSIAFEDLILPNLAGTSSAERLSGSSANDRFMGLAGNDTLDGGSGIDVAIYQSVARDYTLIMERDGKASIRGVSGDPSAPFFVSIDDSDSLSSIESLQFLDKVIPIGTKSHGSYADLPDTLYQFFVVGFGAAAGVTYMDQMAEAYRYWLPEYKDGTVKQIVEAFTTKTQFTNVYPQALYRSEGSKYYAYAHDQTQAGNPLVRGNEVTKAAFDAQMASLAKSLVETIVKTSASEATKTAAATDVQAALGLGGDWTIGKVIYTVFGNLASKPPTDAEWAGTAKQFANQVAVAKYYTDTLSQSTDDVATLRSVMAAVSNTTDVSSNDAIASLIGVALLNGPGI